MQCELCERDVNALTIHHLVPRQRLRRQGVKSTAPVPTVAICSACHRQVHVLFSNVHLARELNSVEKLKAEPSMQRFLDWVRKQDPQKRVKVRRG